MLPAGLTRELLALERDGICLLETAVTHGTVVVVTNAAKGWVQQSGRRFIPRVVECLKAHSITVVSAQAAFARSCPSGDPTDWKKKAFMREMAGAQSRSGENINMISIGDSIFEREATHYASGQLQVQTTKTVKFIDSPTIEQLRRQLVTVTAKMPMICGIERSFDADMEL